MKTSIYNEQKARAVLAAKSTAELIKIFEQTTARKGQGVYMLRGWLMDEIEKRDPVGFNAWLERYADDNALFYYINENRTEAKG